MGLPHSPPGGYKGIELKISFSPCLYSKLVFSFSGCQGPLNAKAGKHKQYEAIVVLQVGAERGGERAGIVDPNIGKVSPRVSWDH